ncbi:MAG: hypothetical protein AB1411_02450 [Nitrospirota bacterium]
MKQVEHCPLETRLSQARLRRQAIVQGISRSAPTTLKIGRIDPPHHDDHHGILPVLRRHDRLLKKFARDRRMLITLDPAYDAEDIEQELVLATIEAQKTWDSVRGRKTKFSNHLYLYGQKQIQKIFRGHDVLVDIIDKETGHVIETMSHSKFSKRKRTIDFGRFDARSRPRLARGVDPERATEHPDSSPDELDCDDDGRR